MKRTPLKRRTPLRKSRPDPAWIAAREAALDRDGRWPACHRYRIPDHECWGGLEVHHIVRRSQGGTHDLDNLVTLCTAGHRWVHEHPAEATLLGLLRRGAA